MTNLFDIIKFLYQKNKSIPEINEGILIVVNKWLSWDSNNLGALHKILKYLFFIDPLHYYYLLFFNIPKRNRVPFLKKIDQETVEETQLVRKIQYVLGWSNRELLKNRSILSKTILKEQKYWKEELGL